MADSQDKNSELHNAMLVSCPFLKPALYCMKIGGFIGLQKTEVHAEAISNYYQQYLDLFNLSSCLQVSISDRIRENKLKLKPREMKRKTTDPWAPRASLLLAVLVAEAATVTNQLYKKQQIKMPPQREQSINISERISLKKDIRPFLFRLFMSLVWADRAKANN